MIALKSSMKGISISYCGDFNNKDLLQTFTRLTDSTIVCYDYGERSERGLYNGYSEVDGQISKALTPEHKFILSSYCENYLLNTPSLKRHGLPVIIHTGDCWTRLHEDKLKRIVEIHEPDILLLNNVSTIPMFREYLENSKIKLLWSRIPYESDICKDYGLEKIHDVGYSGKFSGYPERKRLDMYFTRRSTVVGDITYKRYDWSATLEEYAKNINQCWMSYTSCQKDHRLYWKGQFIGSNQRKNMEIPACGVALIAIKWLDADIMGFKDGINFIEYSDYKELFDKVRYYLDDKDKLKELILKGKELAQEYTMENCANKLIEELKVVL